MATPMRDAVETFMSITGASEPIAVQRLQEHGGNLNEAVNAHFAGGNPQRPISASAVYPHYDSTEVHNPTRGEQYGILPLLSAVRSFKPSSLLDPDYRRSFLNQIGVSAVSNNSPVASSVSQTMPHYCTQPGPTPPLHSNNQAVMYRPNHYESYAEQAMIQAAIEASKRESSPGLMQTQVGVEDAELSHAIALSLMTGERERVKHEHQMKGKDLELEGSPSGETAEGSKVDSGKLGSSSHEDESGYSEGRADGRPNQETYSYEVAKAGILPEEPPLDCENTINLAVKMPDGNRLVRRFLNSDRLQSVFNFIDLVGGVKPGDYRLVIPYPRQALESGEHSLSLRELGLISKHEVVFLELI